MGFPARNIASGAKNKKLSGHYFTNRQVRAEIGSALWKKDIRVDVDHWEYLLIDFLEDRPAIHEGIKELRMEWASEGSPRAVDSEIIEYCEYLSEHLELNNLGLALCTTPLVARAIVGLQNSIAWVQVFRKIKMEALGIKILDESEGHDEDEIYDLAEEIKPLLELALHPPPVDTTSDISDE